MKFDDLAGFLQVYGWGMTLKQATKRFHSDTVAGIAKRLGVVFRDTDLHVRGLEHLPGLPGTATAKTWAGGTTYRIPTDCPGIPSITIHNAHTPADEREHESNRLDNQRFNVARAAGAPRMRKEPGP